MVRHRQSEQAALETDQIPRQLAGRKERKRAITERTPPRMAPTRRIVDVTPAARFGRYRVASPNINPNRRLARTRHALKSLDGNFQKAILPLVTVLLLLLLARSFGVEQTLTDIACFFLLLLRWKRSNINWWHVPCPVPPYHFIPVPLEPTCRRFGGLYSAQLKTRDTPGQSR